jgi:hypothetical protein
MKATAHITESWGFVVVIFFDSVGSCVYYYNNQTTQAPQLVDEQHSAKYADNFQFFFTAAFFSPTLWLNSMVLSSFCRQRPFASACAMTPNKTLMHVSSQGTSRPRDLAQESARDRGRHVGIHWRSGLVLFLNAVLSLAPSVGSH